MAPRPPQQRRTIAPQEHIYELGVAGRKTGITVKDSGVRDEHGMEPLDALFSSPRKGANSDDDSDDGSGEPMELTTNLGAGPAALLSGPAKRLSFPLPISRSPVKTTLNSPAQRNRLLARSSSPTHGDSFRDHHSQPAPRSRLGPKKPETNGSHSQPLFRKGMPTFSATDGYTNGHRRSDPSVEDSDVEEEPEDEVEQLDDDGVGAYVEESMAMLTAEAELDYDDDAPAEQEAPAEESEEEPSPPPRAANPRKAAALRPKTNGAPPAKRGRPAKPAPVVEEEDSDADMQNGDEPENIVESEEEEVAPPPRRRAGKEKAKAPTPEPEPEPEDNVESEEEEVAPPPRRRAGKEKAKAPTPEPEAEPEVNEESEEEQVAPPPRRKADKEKAKAPTPDPQPPTRKRRSLTDVEAEEKASPPAARQNKRQRTNESSEPPAAIKRDRPAKSAAPSTSKASASKPAPAPKAKKTRKRKSSLAAGDTSQVAIPRGPPLPKARGLLITRCEVPGQANSTFKQTRSGRNSMRPLAFWRNERVDYETGTGATEEDVFLPKSRPSNFVLPSIKEVVRVDEPEPSRPTKSKRGRPKKGRRASGDSPPREPWETSPGLIDGPVIAWRAEHEFNPPAPDGMVATEVRELAVAAGAVQTQPVKDANFRYAKTLNEGFFNAGVVELPPGSEKRPKNSRKMFMSFFLHTGRVLVTVNETSFRIGEGGMWFVPRGNYYSIENDYDQPAKVFFSQGCEVAPRLEEEEEAEEAEEDDAEDDDGDGEDEEEEEEA